MKESSNLSDDDDYENDDLINFQFDSKKINLSYSQLVKYSKHIREGYVFSDILNRLPNEIHKYQAESLLSGENIKLFFNLLKQNYNINEDQNESKLTYKECFELLKISKYFKVRKLKHEVKKYIRNRKNNIDFILEMMLHEEKTEKAQKDLSENDDSTNSEIEELLTNKIDECLKNDKFIELPILLLSH